jgi:roadblock/LC7 domain-containing protein
MKAELDKLKTIPLLNGKLPGGTYTVMVMGDDGSETSLIEFEIPNL